MIMLRAALALVAVAALAGGGARPATAEIYRPWCVQYQGASGDNGTPCTFMSFEQCMLTARGSGAFCVQNPWYLQYGSGQKAAETNAERPKRR